jgi:hypothetical protein
MTALALYAAAVSVLLLIALGGNRNLAAHRDFEHAGDRL